jgi:hypothetical protein
LSATSDNEQTAGSTDDAHDVGFLHDQKVFAVDLDFGAGPLAEQNAVTSLDVESDDLAGLVTSAGSDGHDFAFLRLFLGGVGNDDAALGLSFGLNASDDDAIVKGAEIAICLIPLLIRVSNDWRGIGR